MVLCASALPEKHKVNYQYCLQDDYCRNTVFKLIVQRFMMPDFHSQPCSDASACQGKQDERCCFAFSLSIPYIMNVSMLNANKA